MISYNQALKAIGNNIKPLPLEMVKIELSFGRIITQNLTSPINLPPFNKSAVDGYALRSQETKNRLVKLHSIGCIEAGQNFTKPIKPKECVKIMTGAAIPKNLDSVIMLEEIKTSLKNFILISRKVAKGENVCLKGEDIKKGQKVINKNRIIKISDIALLAGIGKSEVLVRKKPEVAIINTGGEIINPGQKLKTQQIYNSNGPQLKSLLLAEGITPNFLGIAKDTPKELIPLISQGLKADILLISGGVSMGDFDLVPKILGQLGVKKIFHKVKIKPGKPVFFGKKNKTYVFGIPGNPVSNFLIYLLLIKPAIYKLLGYKNYLPKFKLGKLTQNIYNKPGRLHFVLVNVEKKADNYLLKPILSHGSADILSLAKANGFMLVEENEKQVKANSIKKFISW